MNEELKGVKKDRTVYQIQPFDKTKTSFEDTHRKGYVNWPIATENSKYQCVVTHLPTGLALGNILYAQTWTENKIVIDKIVNAIGDKLEHFTEDTSTHNENAVKTLKELLWTENFEKPKDPVQTVDITVLQHCPSNGSYTVGQVKRIIPKAEFQTMLQGEDITVDGKVLRDFLAKLDNNAEVWFSISEDVLLQKISQRRDYSVYVSKEIKARCLTVEYEERSGFDHKRGSYFSGIRGTANFKEVIGE